MDPVAYAESDLPEWAQQIDKLVESVDSTRRDLLKVREQITAMQARTGELTDIDGWWDFRDTVSARLHDLEGYAADLGGGVSVLFDQLEENKR